MGLYKIYATVKQVRDNPDSVNKLKLNGTNVFIVADDNGMTCLHRLNNYLGRRGYVLDDVKKVESNSIIIVN